MAEEVNHQNNGATLILDAVNYEDSEHTFYLGLPPYSEKDNLINFINDKEKRWPSVDFSFSDGNLKEVKNLFTLNLDYDLFEEDGDMHLSVTMDVELVPGKVNEKLAPIKLNFARISFVNKLEGPSSDADPHLLLFHMSESSKKLGFRSGCSDHAYMDWDSNYSGIKIAINVSKGTEGSVDIVPSNTMMTFPSSNMLPTKVGNANFSEYFLTENLSDCKVEAGGKTFPAHRFVLVEISESCKRMFFTDMIENLNREWKIDDFEPEVVQEFLEYAYKGTSKNLTLAQNMGILMDLFRMGHRYDVVLLKAQCEELLKNMINSENVVDLFEFGFLYEMESLMDAAKAYFTRFKQQILPNSAALNDFEKKYSADIKYKLTIE